MLYIACKKPEGVICLEGKCNNIITVICWSGYLNTSTTVAPDQLQLSVHVCTVWEGSVRRRFSANSSTCTSAIVVFLFFFGKFNASATFFFFFLRSLSIESFQDKDRRQIFINLKDFECSSGEDLWRGGDMNTFDKCRPFEYCLQLENVFWHFIIIVIQP